MSRIRMKEFEIVLASEEYGEDIVFHASSWKEAVECIKDTLIDAADEAETDGIDRIVGIKVTAPTLEDDED